ncbi:MAG: bifunctional phosphoribosylaminoimidazolecarboxamide formyltransferase/IMP cyclohydrolase [Anaerolineales bacterium]
MPTALFSLSDKTGLITFARGLIELGWTLLASGGTARALREADLPVTDIAEYTGSPEILGGRVKTLHPAVHGGILARATDEDAAQLGEINAKYIDLVACSLYPFEQTIGKRDVTLAEAIENIDIGGVTLIRAAAKNHARVTVVTDAADFPEVLQEIQTHGGPSLKMRARLAVKAFAHTADYDAAITKYLSEQLTYDTGRLTPLENHPLRLTLYPIQTLRYGENWHQTAEIYGYTPNAGPMGGHLLQGKPLSYNNMLDLDAAWRAAVSFERPSVVIVKHLSPCGVACDDTLGEAYPRAFASDPVSAFGGVVAVNRPFDAGIANQLGDLFLECIAAPGFTPEAMEILSKKKNLRLLAMPDTSVEPEHELRSITRGFVRQSLDFGDPVGTEWKVVTERQPTPEEWAAMRFAWIACQHVKSNSIVFAVGEATVGIGGGQPNRVDCVKIAAERAGEKAKGAVMASDAFFPFPDSVEMAAKYGITAIVQPGGSVRDDLSIEACNKYGMAMVFTGVRHFRH